MTQGKLQEEVPALFVTGVTDASLAVTDILSVRNGELTNVVLSDLTGVSGEIAFDDQGDAIRDTAYIKTADNANAAWTLETVQTVG